MRFRKSWTGKQQLVRRSSSLFQKARSTDKSVSYSYVCVRLIEQCFFHNSIIHKIISREEQYLQDLDIVESDFIKPLRTAKPPVLSPDKLEEFIDDVFGNILDLRECNRHLLEMLNIRQREQAPIIHGIGDIFLDAATEFRLAYPIYIGHYPVAEKRMREEIENNPVFRLFIEVRENPGLSHTLIEVYLQQCTRQSSRPGEVLRLDLKHFLNRPSEHLQKYPVTLEAIRTETAVGNPDADYLTEAIEAIKNLQSVAQLRTFQSAMGKGPAGKWEWHDLVSPEVRQTISKQEAKRQASVSDMILFMSLFKIAISGSSLNLSRQSRFTSRTWKASRMYGWAASL